MPRTTIPIIGGHNKDRSINLNAQETVNLYTVLGGPSGKHEMALVGTPGMVEFCDIGATAEVRNMIKLGDYLFAVVGNTLYKIDTDGTKTAISGTLSTSTGHVYMEHDGTNLMIVDPGVDGYVYKDGSGDFTADAGTDVITSAAHGRADNSTIEFTNSGGALPAGLSAGTTYYVINAATDTFKVSLTLGGAAVDITDAGTGTHSWNALLAAVADTDFPTPSSLTWQDGYFIVGEEGAGRFFISSLYDPTSWDALDYATAEGSPDKLLRPFSNQLVLWLLGEKTTEPWYNSGAADFPFNRYGATLIATGIGAAASIAAGNNMMFWFTDQRTVVMAAGLSPATISTRALENEWAGYSTVSDAKGFVYTQEGHTFYVLIFPTANATWAFDTTTAMWHRRRSYPVYPDGIERRHRANCHAYFAGKHLIGDFLDGKIYEWDLDTYTDDGEEIRRSRVTQVIHANRLRVFFHRYEIEMEAGTGLLTGGTAWAATTAYSLGDRVVPTALNGCIYECTSAGTSAGSEPTWTITVSSTIDDGTVEWTCLGNTPHVVLSWSDDGGHTYGNEHWRSFGSLGAFGFRTFWNRLGASRDRRFKISITDPVKTVILSACAEIEVGNN